MRPELKRSKVSFVEVAIDVQDLATICRNASDQSGGPDWLLRSRFEMVVSSRTIAWEVARRHYAEASPSCTEARINLADGLNDRERCNHVLLFYVSVERS